MKYYFPLTKLDLEILKRGGLVTKNFSPPLEPDKMLMVVAWNKSKVGKLDKRRYRGARQAGIDVANIPLKEKDISKIVGGDGISVFYSDFEILVLSQETLLKLQA